MKISVIVPVYNCEPYVARCVRSIMAQTYTDLEIICIDDGSSDGSGEILDALALEDKRLRVVHQGNAGASAARNAGIDLATGDFITFVDSDDAIEPDMYETLLSLFSDDEIDIAHCGYKRVYADGSIKDINGTGKRVIQDRYEASQCLLLGTLFVGSMCNKLYKAHLFADVRLDTTIAINEDVLANAALFSRARRASFLDEGKYLVYERAGSASFVTKAHKKLSDSVRAAEHMLQIYKGTPAQKAAEERVLNTQVDLYRWYVMHSFRQSKQARKQLATTIGIILRQRRDISLRQRVNYALMRYVPHPYKMLYAIYDKIRIPNWDVKPEE